MSSPIKKYWDLGIFLGYLRTDEIDVWGKMVVYTQRVKKQDTSIERNHKNKQKTVSNGVDPEVGQIFFNSCDTR